MSYLNDTWSYYYHDPFDHDWSYKSYRNLCTLTSVQDFWGMKTYSDEKFLQSMYFLMREHVFPCWDDVENKNGGCFTMRVLKEDSIIFWEKIFIKCLGETLLKEEYRHLWDNVNGLSSSPKKNFYVFKIWVKNVELESSYFDLPSNFIHGEIQFKKNMDSIQDK